MYVTVCMPRCGWVGNPAGGDTRNSSSSRKGSKSGNAAEPMLRRTRAPSPSLCSRAMTTLAMVRLAVADAAPVAAMRTAGGTRAGGVGVARPQESREGVGRAGKRGGGDASTCGCRRCGRGSKQGDAKDSIKQRAVQSSHHQRGGGGALRVMNATLCRGQSSSSSRRRHVCAWSVDVDDSVHLQTRLKSRMAGNECEDMYL